MDLTGFLFQPDFNDEGVGGGGGDPQRGRGVDSGGGGASIWGVGFAETAIRHRPHHNVAAD